MKNSDGTRTSSHHFVALARRFVPALSISAFIWLAFTCSNPVDKLPLRPVLSIVADTTVSVKDSLVLVAHTGTGGGKATVYLWFLDGRILAAPVAADSICRLFFGIADTGGHVVVVRALGEGKSVSEADTAQVTVLLHPPVVHLVTRDTTVFAGDTVRFVAQGKDSNGTVIAYRWSIGDTAVAATAGTLAFCFPPVAGTYRIRVTAMDDDSILSAPDSIHVNVVVDNPRIAAQHDTVVAVNDTIILRAARLDTFSSPVRWIWARNGVLFSDTTQGPLFAVRFGRAEAGTRTVLVKAVSSHRLQSNIDSVYIAVHLYAPTVSIVHDTSVFANTPVTLRAYGADTNGRVVKYAWAMDDVHFADTTLGDSIVHTWSRADTGSRIVVRVKAIDDDTIASNADSVHITVHLKPLPTVTMTPDTVVFINDSFSLAAKAMPGGTSPVTAFVWALDNRPFEDTSAAGRKALRFSRADTGRHVVRVKAIDRDTMASLAESTVVQVRLGMPVVKAMNDTAVFINDTAVVHATGSDTNGVVVRYLWSIDKGGYTDTTVPGVFVIVWSKQDTGRHTVRVKAVDDDTVLSRPDSFAVLVKLGMPVVQALRDTAVLWGDTVMFVIRAIDTNGSIVQYLVNTSGVGAWTDSSSRDTFKLTSSIHADRKVVAAARDDDGLVAADTFTVRFLSRPCTLGVLGLKPQDTVLVHSTDPRPFAVPLSFSAARKDAAADTFTYSIWSGGSPSSLSKSPTGLDTTGMLSLADTGKWYWKVMAVDGHADTASTPVSLLSIKLEPRICFVGHSIVTGLDGTYGLGGFRRMVVDTLRAAAGPGRRFKCEGPITTQNLLPVADDSCCAVIGKTCAAIFDSMQDHSLTNADIWVYMNGVNEAYEFPTYNRFWWRDNYSAATIDTMHGRNPAGEIYVLNALPFPKDTAGDFTYKCDSMFKANLPVFNRMLDSVITSRRQEWLSRGEGGVWLVDAFDSMAVLPDSVSNPVYFFDYLHPNQSGYDRLGKVVLGTMRAAKSAFLK
jgi:PKD domain